MTAACLVRGTTDTVTIIDLGGGVGIYYTLIKRITTQIGIKLKYAVVDGAENCRNGTAFHGASEEIRFFDFNDHGIAQASQFLGQVNVLNICGTLHYILDWKAALNSASQLNPTVICISRAPTPDLADTEGYVIQHIHNSLGYCGQVQVVLIPRKKLISEMQRLDYFLFAEQGNSGDARWYWEEGVSDQIFFQQTVRQFLFLSNRVT